MKIFGFAGWSGSGKTTLVTKLIPELVGRGVRVSTMKHAHHAFDIDQPGKDSYEHREAGATEVMVTSGERWALMRDYTQPREPLLEELIAQLDRGQLDLILVEGFRSVPFPKIELHRPSTGSPLLHPRDSSIIAIASDEPLETHLPVLDLNQTDAILAFVLAWMKQANDA